MITIRLTAPDWSRIRFGISPLWETVAALRADRSLGAEHAPSFLSRVIRRLAGLDVPLLRMLVDPARPYLPDFLAPPPDHPEASFDDELERMRATPPSVAQRELQRAGVRIASARVPATLEGIADELRIAWTGAMHREWLALHAVLERDITWRARALAREGTEAMLAGLHPSVVTGEAMLRIESSRTGTCAPRGEGLLLVPSAFAWPVVYVVDTLPWRPTIAYPARGLATPDATVPAGRAIAALTGDGRSRVLLAVQPGATTAQLATSLHLSAGAVSQHLNRLRLAGMVQSTRIGRRVLHELTRRGAAVVAAFRH